MKELILKKKSEPLKEALEENWEEDLPEEFLDNLIRYAKLIQDILQIVGIILHKIQKHLDLLPRKSWEWIVKAGRTVVEQSKQWQTKATI